MQGCSDYKEPSTNTPLAEHPLPFHWHRMGDCGCCLHPCYTFILLHKHRRTSSVINFKLPEYTSGEAKKAAKLFYTVIRLEKQKHLVCNMSTIILIDLHTEFARIRTLPMLVQILLSQSVSQESQGWVVRGLLELWLFTTWVLRVSYTCNLMAFLTVPVLQAPLDGLEHLADADLR